MLIKINLNNSCLFDASLCCEICMCLEKETFQDTEDDAVLGFDFVASPKTDEVRNILVLC